MFRGINGQTVYCRTTEEKILKAWEGLEDRKISIRDTVKNHSIAFSQHKVVMIYKLWNTNLIERFDDDIYIHISSNQEEIDRYTTGWNYCRRDYIISNTTKSRLNTFLNYYGFNSLEVHSSMKDWSVKYNGEKLEVDKWYKLDFVNHKLDKVVVKFSNLE